MPDPTIPIHAAHTGMLPPLTTTNLRNVAASGATAKALAKVGSGTSRSVNEAAPQERTIVTPARTVRPQTLADIVESQRAPRREEPTRRSPITEGVSPSGASMAARAMAGMLKPRN